MGELNLHALRNVANEADGTPRGERIDGARSLVVVCALRWSLVSLSQRWGSNQHPGKESYRRCSELLGDHLSVVLGARFAFMQDGHHVAAWKEILSKSSGLLSTRCVDQRPDDLALGELNSQVEQLAHGFLSYTPA